jgi:integrase
LGVLLQRLLHHQPKRQVLNPIATEEASHAGTTTSLSQSNLEVAQEQLRTQQQRYGIHRAMSRLGIQTPKGVHIGVHCFRHGVTTSLLESGTPIHINDREQAARSSEKHSSPDKERKK